MISHSERSMLYWQHGTETISELTTYKDRLKVFKTLHALPLIFRFKNKDNTKPESKFNFCPILQSDAEQINVGIFTTLLCLETISAYNEEIIEFKKQHSETEWLGMDEDSFIGYTNFVFSQLPKLKKGKKKRVGLAGVAILVKYKKYFNNFKKRTGKDEELFTRYFNKDSTKNMRDEATKFIIETFVEIEDNLSPNNLNLDPFYLNRCLQFLYLWKKEIIDILTNLKDICAKLKLDVKLTLIMERIQSSVDRKDMNTPKDESESKTANDDAGKKDPPITPSRFFNYFFDTIYFLGKYELYRQLSLKQSGDEGLYDVKRLIYSLLIVSYRNRFSNEFVKRKALETIFKDQKTGNHSIWPTGQLLVLSYDTKMSVSSIECINDLLDCTAIANELHNHFDSIKKIFDFYAITLRYEDIGEKDPVLTGWFPPDQRDKTVTGTETAFVLHFIKHYCSLISQRIKILAEQSFLQNFRSKLITWDKIYDSSAVKLKFSELIKKPYCPKIQLDFVESASLPIA